MNDEIRKLNSLPDWEDVRDELLAEDPEAKKEYEKIKLERKIAERIIEFRKKKRISQRKLASLINTKQPSIARFESGELTPSLSFLKRIADVLDLDIDVVFKEKEKVG